MKTLKRTIIASVLFLTICIYGTPIFADDPPPPPPNGGNGDQEPPGGGAPIEGGMIILIGLAAGYASWKSRQQNRSSVDSTGHQSAVMASEDNPIAIG